MHACMHAAHTSVVRSSPVRRGNIIDRKQGKEAAAAAEAAIAVSGLEKRFFRVYRIGKEYI